MTFHEIPMMAIGLLAAAATIVIFLVSSRRTRDDTNLMVSVNQKNMQDDINNIKGEQKELNKEIRDELRRTREAMSALVRIVDSHGTRLDYIERRDTGYRGDGKDGV